ncbi:MAG: endo-1,4-beta-xylanase, partial [Spirochaetota bacterium]
MRTRRKGNDRVPGARLLGISALVLAAALLIGGCSVGVDPTSASTEAAPSDSLRAIADGESRYLGSTLGPTNQNNSDYSLYIPDRDGNHNFTDYWNQVTAENDHKWGYLQNGRDSFNSDTVQNARDIYDYAKDNGIPLKFHTLIWGR